jgi:hypothetical protein
MHDKRINQSEHNCCSIPASGDASICKECGNKGKSVKGITLIYLYSA